MSWKEPATAAAAVPHAAPTTSTPHFSRRKAWWWRVLTPVEWVLGGLPLHRQPPATTAAAVTKKTRSFNPGGWLISRWKKTAQFRSNMRWGSLSYIATTWEEEIASTDGCSTDGRAKAGSRGACDNNKGEGEDTMVLAAILRSRCSQCLIVGALVTVTVAYAIYRSRHKPRRPSPPLRPGVKPSDKTTGVSAVKNDETDGGGGDTGGECGDGMGSAGDSNPELTHGFGDGSRQRGNDADLQKSPRSSHSRGDNGGGGDEDVDRRAKNDGQTHRDRKSAPSKHQDTAPKAFPSPEHHREEDGGRGVSWDALGAEQRVFEPALGKTESVQEQQIMPFGVEDKGGGKEEGGIRAGSTGVNKRRDHVSVSNNPVAAPMELPRNMPSLSESSTEDLLAEADSLIAADVGARKAFTVARTTPARSSKHRASASGSASRLSNARATRPRSVRGSSSSSSKSKGVTSNGSRSSQPRPKGARGGGARGRSSDPRMPKRARMYREVSGEEVDALVNLTHRALQLEPAALSEIAEDASLQRREDGDSAPSVGELAANASVVWGAEAGAGKAAARGGKGAAVVSTKRDLWGGGEEET